MFARTLCVVALLASAPALASAQQPPARTVMALRPCTAVDLSPAADNENGAFDATSHSGTLVVLRNLSPTACSVPGIPQLTLLDAASKPLSATPELPGARFLHPGPVVLPVPVAPGAEVTATMRWVSGAVYTDNLCLDARSLAITIAGQKLRTDLTAHLCGERAKGVSFELSRFATDPVYKPAPTPQLASSERQ